MIRINNIKPIPFFCLLLIGTFFSCGTDSGESLKKEELSNWNDTPLKQEIIDFVTDITTPGSPEFVAEEDRIAVFDNDGTLWNEKPLYIPVEYEIAYLKKEVPKNPELQKNNFYKKIAEGNLKVLKDYSSFELINLLFASHMGQKELNYENSVYTFLTENKHSRFNRPFKEMVFQPMVELVHYLQENDFKVYIVTGGEISFVRTVSKEIYNIEPENVVGSSVLLKYVSDTTGTYLVRTEKIQSINDKYVKPANIELHIGKKPIFAAGNSDGDYEMMQYTLSGDGPSMAIIVNHDDKEREYAYMHGTEKAIADADSIGWKIVSMRSEFNIVFPEK